MPQQNVEVAREAIEAWNAGDMGRLRELYDPDAVMRYAVSDWPEPGPFLGRDAIMRQSAGSVTRGMPTPSTSSVTLSPPGTGWLYAPSGARPDAVPEPTWRWRGFTPCAED